MASKLATCISELPHFYTSLTGYLIDAVLHLEKICSGSSLSQVSVIRGNEHSGRATDNTRNKQTIQYYKNAILQKVQSCPLITRNNLLLHW